MGVTACDPATLDLPSSATDLRDGSWVNKNYTIACLDAHIIRELKINFEAIIS
jgi:hypothetical protein